MLNEEGRARAIVSGDEARRTQRGNNNAYCQDNEISWLDWDNIDEALLQFTSRLVALRAESPTFRRRSWFHGRDIRGVPDIQWLKHDGTEMSDEDWETGHTASIGTFLNGEAIGQKDRRGRPVVDDSFLIILNASPEDIEWALPSNLRPGWRTLIDTAAEGFLDEPVDVKDTFGVSGRSVVVLRREREETG